MLISCPTCRALVPSTLWTRHKASHRGRQPNGRNGSTRSYRRNRAIAIERDHHRCQACGRHETELARLEIQLETHHVDENHLNDDPTNLQTLCAECHPRGPRKDDQRDGS